jgi:hypothetical protein
MKCLRHGVAFCVRWESAGWQRWAGPVGWLGQPRRAAVLEANFARERERAVQG